MKSFWFCVLGPCLAISSAAAFAQDDAVWIERHLRNGGGTAIGPPPQGRVPDPIAVANLDRYVGQDVRLTLSSGRVRDGRLQRVEGDEVFLRSRMGGGYANVSFSRSQVVRAELE